MALHPLRCATPKQKRCNADGSGAVPPTTTTTARNASPHTLSGSPRRSHTAARCSPQQRVSIAETKQELHPIRAATPVTVRYTRYGAVHPNGRGVMPTDRVQCPHDKSKSRLPCASSLTTVLRHCHAAVEHSVEHCDVPHVQVPPTRALSLSPPGRHREGRCSAELRHRGHACISGQSSRCRWARPPQRAAGSSHRSIPARAYRSPVRLTPLPTPARCSSRAR